jgi:hypothetical protein
MNPEGFILEVPAELQMRRSRRRKEDIMYAKAKVSMAQRRLRMLACGRRIRAM